MQAYVDDMAPSARQLYSWMEERDGDDDLESGTGGGTSGVSSVVSFHMFVERVHDEAEDYYSRYEARAMLFHEQSLQRWAGRGELQRAERAFSAASQKASVLPRGQLKRLLMDLGYPVNAHKDAIAVLEEFTHPKDRSFVLYPELMHAVKTLAVVRFEAEKGRGDFLIASDGTVTADALNEPGFGGGGGGGGVDGDDAEEGNQPQQVIR